MSVGGQGNMSGYGGPRGRGSRQHERVYKSFQAQATLAEKGWNQAEQTGGDQVPTRPAW